MLTATYLDSSVPRTWDATKRRGCNRPVYRGWWKWTQKCSKERTIPIWKLSGMPLFPLAQVLPFLLHCRTHQLDAQCTFHNHNQRTTNLCPLIQPPVVVNHSLQTVRAGGDKIGYLPLLLDQLRLLPSFRVALNHRQPFIKTTHFNRFF